MIIQTEEPASCTSRRLELPPFIAAVLDALAFQDVSFDGVRSFDSLAWQSMLPWCDARQITLLLGARCESVLPRDIGSAIARRRVEFEARMLRIQRQLDSIANALHDAGIWFVVLKGFTHAPNLCPDPILRAQGDIDLWCEPGSAQRAHVSLQALGYRPGPSHSDRHMPPLRLPVQEKWNGRMADLPISVELHHTLWSEEAEHVRIPGVDAMWERRERRLFDWRTYDVLAAPDLVGFAALHVYLHLIHGDLPLQRVWEIANFLNSSLDDSAFWKTWADWHSPELKRIEVVVFRIAAEWFSCDLPDCIREQSERLPDAVQCWLKDHAWEPLRSQANSNLNHFWLRLAMADGNVARAKILSSALTTTRARGKRRVTSIIPTLAGGFRWATATLFSRPRLFASGLHNDNNKRSHNS